MTRINAGIKPEQLIDQHLLAEHREIKRLPTLFGKKQKPFKVPTQFKLGTGHVTFFLDKGKYSLERYLELHAECVRRGFNTQDFSSNWLNYNDFPAYNRDWVADELDRKEIINRISTRILESSQIPRYFGNPIDKFEAIRLLSK